MNGFGNLAYSRRPQRIATGPDAMRAANAIREAELRRDSWPYPSVYAPPGAIRRNPEGFILANAVGAVNQAVVLSFAVPSGFDYLLQAVLLAAVPDTLLDTLGPGAFTFSIDRNTPLGGGALQGGPLADWSAINFPYGSVAVGPVRLHRCEVFSPEDIIRVKVVNNTVTPGVPNYFLARFDGYLIPTQGKE
jgi:hypothetical protein